MKRLLFTLLFFFIASTPVFAQGNLSDWNSVLDNAAGPDGAGYDTEQYEVEPIIATIIQTVLSFLGVIFLILMIYGGILWMTARGNEAQVTKAKDLITAAIIGLVIVVGSYAISLFVVEALTERSLDM